MMDTDKQVNSCKSEYFRCIVEQLQFSFKTLPKMLVLKPTTNSENCQSDFCLHFISKIGGKKNAQLFYHHGLIYYLLGGGGGGYVLKNGPLVSRIIAVPLQTQRLLTILQSITRHQQHAHTHAIHRGNKQSQESLTSAICWSFVGNVFKVLDMFQGVPSSIR